MTFSRVLALIVLTWVFVYTVSYGNWTWKKKNRLGAVMLYSLAIAAVALPVYTIFFRE